MEQLCGIPRSQAAAAPWLRLDRLFGEHGLKEDSAAARREFARRMRVARMQPGASEAEALRGGWKIKGEDFSD